MMDATATAGGVFTEPERARLRAAFRTGTGAATEAEADAFLAWVWGVRVEGALLTLVLEGLALPIRPEGGGSYQFRAAAEGEQPG